MSWIVDNANVLMVLFAVIAAGLVIAWRSNSNARYLLYAAGALALVGLIWLVSIFGTSDRKQIHDHINAMSDAVVTGKMDDLFKHISPEFRYKDMTRDDLFRNAQAAVKVYKVRQVRITAFRVDELSRDTKTAKARFRASVWWGEKEDPYLMSVQTDFVLEGEQWKLKTMRFYNPLVDQDKEIDLPFPR
jgi:hypothetical protein